MALEARCLRECLCWVSAMEEAALGVYREWEASLGGCPRGKALGRGCLVRINPSWVGRISEFGLPGELGEVPKECGCLQGCSDLVGSPGS